MFVRGGGEGEEGRDATADSTSVRREGGLRIQKERAGWLARESVFIAWHELDANLATLCMRSQAITHARHRIANKCVDS